MAGADRQETFRHLAERSDALFQQAGPTDAQSDAPVFVSGEKRQIPEEADQLGGPVFGLLQPSGAFERLIPAILNSGLDPRSRSCRGSPITDGDIFEVSGLKLSGLKLSGLAFKDQALFASAGFSSFIQNQNQIAKVKLPDKGTSSCPI
jgi:hypothetical protein